VDSVRFILQLYFNIYSKYCYFRQFCIIDTVYFRINVVPVYIFIVSVCSCFVCAILGYTVLYLIFFWLISTSRFLRLFFFYWFLARQPPVGQSLLIHEVSRLHTTTHHIRNDSSGRVISSSQRPLPDNTQHSQQTDIHAPGWFEPTISAGERPQT